MPRRSNDVTYFTRDAALELEGLRGGGPGWWLRGEGDTRDPSDVSRVLVTSERSKVVGYDLIVAAPRPISILLAIDPDHGAGVIGAHRASVRATMDYLEDRALVVRDRRNGHDREESATWESVVAFTHGVNRHGEPHLHDHVLVGAQPEGHSNVLDSRALFAHALAADALYRASLRHELASRTRWTAWRSFEGIERVDGLDEGYRALWWGTTGTEARSCRGLVTRRCVPGRAISAALSPSASFPLRAVSETCWTNTASRVPSTVEMT
jgi:hypothetical protein